VITSLVVFTALYGVLAVIDGVLMVRYAKAGPPDVQADRIESDAPQPLAVAY
jgi:cytochrome d ubiquinol oxidase subunit I